jgi:hypothetical protein
LLFSENFKNFSAPVEKIPSLSSPSPLIDLRMLLMLLSAKGQLRFTFPLCHLFHPSK